LTLAGGAGKTSYGSLFRTPGFKRLTASIQLARIGGGMWSVLIVLLALLEFHSPLVAGLAAFFSLAPGLALSPLAGALLDRYGRVRLILLDYLVGIGIATAILVLALAGVLQPWLLLVVVALGSLTVPLGTAGARSLIPLMVPRTLWERANALDSAMFAIENVIGPAIAGFSVALVGPRWAMAVLAAAWGAAAATLAGLREPHAEGAGGAHGILREALAGVVYSVRNPVLRGIALGIPVANCAQGLLVVALPVLVLNRLHGGPALVGYAWAMTGIGTAASGLLFGRQRTEGRERLMIVLGEAGAAIGFVLVAGIQTLTGLMGGMFLIGLASGPLDVAMFSLRQRATDPAWYGRAFAISSSVNYLGMPIGSAVSGPLIAISLTGALGAAAAFSFLAAGVLQLALPGRARPAARAS
jgi:MFS family permease